MFTPGWDARSSLRPKTLELDFQVLRPCCFKGNDGKVIHLRGSSQGFEYVAVNPQSAVGETIGSAEITFDGGRLTFSGRLHRMAESDQYVLSLPFSSQLRAHQMSATHRTAGSASGSQAPATQEPPELKGLTNFTYLIGSESDRRKTVRNWMTIEPFVAHDSYFEPSVGGGFYRILSDGTRRREWKPIAQCAQLPEGQSRYMSDAAQIIWDTRAGKREISGRIWRKREVRAHMPHPIW